MDLIYLFAGDFLESPGDDCVPQYFIKARHVIYILSVLPNAKNGDFFGQEAILEQLVSSPVGREGISPHFIALLMQVVLVLFPDINVVTQADHVDAVVV
jgi:hypothetical protein